MNRNNSASSGSGLPFENTLTPIEVKLQQEHPDLKICYQEVLDAQQNAGEVYEKEQEALARDKEAAEQENAVLDAEEENLKEAHRETCAEREAELKAAREAQRQAEFETAQYAALSGVKWSPHLAEAIASEAPAIGGTTFAYEGITGVIKGVWSIGAKILKAGLTNGRSLVHMPPAMGLILTLAVGSLLGLSIGLMSHVIERDTLARHPLELLFFCAIGWGAAIGIRYGLTVSWHNAGRYDILETSGRSRLLTKVVALVTSLFVLLAEGAVERAGLLRVILSDSSGLPDPTAPAMQAGDYWLLWLVGMLVSSGFVVYYSITGFTGGRHEARIEQAETIRRLEMERMEAIIRSAVDPRRAAQQRQLFDQSVIRVGIEKNKCNQLRHEIQEEKARYKDELARIGSSRRMILTSLSEDARKRIAAAESRVEEKKAKYDRMLSDIRHEVTLAEAAAH